ncbi:hypothetical protein C1H46_045024 [Malus baccata]|uniref:Uncharacterized protein n=1 Tax=Malus baccata TaxID=106549 RepID=A0A540K5E9_MALBA|nr:hypothetical protein C1H46_045024 [Malus baccata]
MPELVKYKVEVLSNVKYEIIIFFDNPYQITAGFFVENTIVVAEGEMLLECVFQAMGKLGTVLSAFEDEEFAPCLFVFMGNFCSRPCNLAFHSFSSLRLKLGTKDVVFFRQDLLYRMRRSCLVPPCAIETDDHFEHVISLPLFPTIFNISLTDVRNH